MKIKERITMVTIEGVTEEEWKEVRRAYLRSDAEEGGILFPIRTHIDYDEWLDALGCTEAEGFNIWAGLYYRDGRPHSMVMDERILDYFQNQPEYVEQDIGDQMNPVIESFIKKLKRLK